MAEAVVAGGAAVSRGDRILLASFLGQVLGLIGFLPKISHSCQQTTIARPRGSLARSCSEAKWPSTLWTVKHLPWSISFGQRLLRESVGVSFCYRSKVLGVSLDFLVRLERGAKIGLQLGR